ncbi:MAG: sigma-70 family RNA polymerase sigma factor [Candidatus Latescibacteria bacterium]|nr:sigma-70 family RNA polymerase sigma factor [Candidatus Latescibacterota bacterium]
MEAQSQAECTEYDESKLVARAREGDRDAFGRLVWNHHVQIHNMVYALVGDRDDADDLAQEVFVKAYRSLPRFRGRSKFHTWLYRIGVNCALDHVRSRNRRRTLTLDCDRSHESAPPDPGSSSPESSDSRVMRKELQAILERALATLPPDHRVAVVLRDIDGLHYDEIAYATNCSIGTVKSRLFRARARLRKVLERDYKEWYGL